MMRNSVKFVFPVASFILLSCERKSDSDSWLHSDSFISHEDKDAKFIRDNTGMPVNDNCHSVYYYMRGGGLQDLTMVAKITCDKDIAPEVVEKLVKWNDSQLNKSGIRASLNRSPFNFEILPNKELSKIKWWDLSVAKISHASISKERFGCSFWIALPDEKDVTIYVYQSS